MSILAKYLKNFAFGQIFEKISILKISKNFKIFDKNFGSKFRKILKITIFVKIFNENFDLSHIFEKFG